MANRRPKIPADIAREVRQRCLFGCVFCGAPIVEYDHIVEFSESNEHDPNNITLLCPNHHRQKTKGIIARSTVAQKNLNPFNRQRNRSIPYRLEPNIAGRQTVNLGGNIATFTSPKKLDNFQLLSSGGVSLISTHVENDFLLISAKFHDEFGTEIITIDRNILVLQFGIWILSGLAVR